MSYETYLTFHQDEGLFYLLMQKNIWLSIVQKWIKFTLDLRQRISKGWHFKLPLETIYPSHFLVKRKVRVESGFVFFSSDTLPCLIGKRKNTGKATTLENPSNSGKTSDTAVKQEPSSSVEVDEEPAYYVSTDDSDSSCDEEKMRHNVKFEKDFTPTIVKRKHG